MQIVLINNVDNDRRIIDLSRFRKNLRDLTFGEIINGHIRDKSRWYLGKCSGSSLVGLPPNAKFADYRYPKIIHWHPAVGSSQRSTQSPIHEDEEYQVQHDKVYAVGMIAGAFFGWMGISFDIFRSRISIGFWLSSIIASIIGIVFSSFYGFQKLLIPSFILLIPFLFMVYSAVKATQSVWAIRRYLR
jgi:hypothetical protein